MEKIKNPFSIPKYLERHSRVQYYLNSYIDKGPITKDFLLWYICGLLESPSSSVKESIMDRINMFRDKELLIKSIVGNLPLWERGISKNIWNMQRPLQYVPVRILNIERDLTEELYYIGTIDFLVGSASGLTTKMTFSKDYVHFCINTLGGLCKEDYLPTDLSYLYALITIKSVGGHLKVFNWAVNNSILSANKKLLKARKGKCISGFTQGDCIDCPLGIDECPLARHEKTYPKGVCICDCKGTHKGYIVKAGICKYCLDNGTFLRQIKEKQNGKII